MIIIVIYNYPLGEGGGGERQKEEAILTSPDSLCHHCPRHIPPSLSVSSPQEAHSGLRSPLHKVKARTGGFHFFPSLPFKTNSIHDLTQRPKISPLNPVYPNLQRDLRVTCTYTGKKGAGSTFTAGWKRNFDGSPKVTNSAILLGSIQDLPQPRPELKL